MSKKVDVTISVYLEIRDAEIYGGKGSVGYAEAKIDLNTSSLDGFKLGEFAEGNIEGFAELFKVPADNIKIIPRFEHERNAEDHGDSKWISAKVTPPPMDGQRLQAIIKHHEWIADYDADWVPEEEKTRHPEYLEVCEIHNIGATWFYACKEDDYQNDVAYIDPLKDLANPVSEIIAWKPLSGLGHPKKL